MIKHKPYYKYANAYSCLRLLLLTLLIIGSTHASTLVYASPAYYENSNAAYRGQQTHLDPQKGGQQVAYPAYQSTIYPPFSGTIPSYTGTVGMTEDDSSSPTRRRSSSYSNFPGMDNDPNISTESPVGDVWSLLFLAAGYGLYRLARRKKKTIEQL